jgi:hypothetical protein
MDSVNIGWRIYAYLWFGLERTERKLPILMLGKRSGMFECQVKRGKRRGETSQTAHARGSMLICVWICDGLDLVIGKDVSDSKLI